MKTEEINKLYNDGKISITEADKLRKGKVDEAVRTKNNEISELYVKGGLSISDTIAYENNLLLERNRKNTSTITTILAVYAVITILGIMISLFGLAQI